MKIIAHLDFIDAYNTLELPVGSPYEAIHSAYRKLASSYHPDRVDDEVKKIAFEEKLKKLNNAHELLRDHFKGWKANHRSGAGCICQPALEEQQVVEQPGTVAESPVAEKAAAESPDAKRDEARGSGAKPAETKRSETKTPETKRPETQKREAKKPEPKKPEPEKPEKEKPEPKQPVKSDGKAACKPACKPGHGKDTGSDATPTNSGEHSPGHIIVLRPSKITPESVRFIAAFVAAFFAASLLCSVGMNRLGKFLQQHDFSGPDVPVTARAARTKTHFVDVDKIRDAEKAQEANRIALEKQTKEEDERHKYDQQIKSHLTRIYDDQLNIQSLNAELEENLALAKRLESSPLNRSKYLKNVELCKEKLFAATDDLRNSRAILAALRIAHPEIPTEYFAPIPVPPIATNLDPSRAPKWSPTG